MQIINLTFAPYSNTKYNGKNHFKHLYIDNCINYIFIGQNGEDKGKMCNFGVTFVMDLGKETKIMDHYVALRKIMHHKSHKEFVKKLDHTLPAIKHHLLNQLVLDLANIHSQSFHLYLNSLLEYHLDLNFVSKIKNRDQDFFGKTLLMIICQAQNFQTAKSLLACKALNVKIQDANGENALFYALRNEQEQNSYQILSAILSRSPELARSKNREDYTLLMVALKKGSIRIVELLLKYSADPNQKCSQLGNTALHQTMLIYSKNSEKMKDLILLLLNFEADPTIANNKNDTCYDLASRFEFDLKRLVNLYKYEQCPQEELNICESELNDVTKDQNSNNSYKDSDDSSSAEDIIPFDSKILSEQMQSFAAQCENKISLAWADFSHIYYKLRQIGRKMNLQIDIIGSYQMGLWTPFSDIDIVFTNLDSESIKIDKYLRQIYEILRKHSRQLGIKQIFLNNSLSFPNIKIELEPRFNRLKLDITIFQKRNNGMKYVKYIKEGLNRYPIIKPIFYTMHKTLQSFQLHNPAKGGLKTYALYLMILFVVSYQPYLNEGDLLKLLVDYYAFEYPYEESFDEQGQLVVRLNISDPLNETNNVGGRKTEAERLRQMFKIVSYGLRQVEGKDLLGYLFSLPNLLKG